MKTATVTIKDPMEEAQEQLERQRALALLPDTAVLLHQDVEQIGAFMMKLGKMMEDIRHGVNPTEAYEKNIGQYGRFDNAAKYIDPREE